MAKLIATDKSSCSLATELFPLLRLPLSIKNPNSTRNFSPSEWTIIKKLRLLRTSWSESESIIIKLSHERIILRKVAKKMAAWKQPFHELLRIDFLFRKATVSDNSNIIVSNFKY